MAEEFETGICSGNWWSNNNNNNSNSTSSAIRKSSPISCSTSALTSLGWPTISTTTTHDQQHEMMMINEATTTTTTTTRSSTSSRDNNNNPSAVSSVSHESSSSINVFQQAAADTTHHNNSASITQRLISSDDSASGTGTGTGGGDTSIFMDSSLQIMGAAAFDDLQSSPTTDWTQLALLNRSHEEELSLSSQNNFQQEPTGLESDHQIFQKDWNTKNFTTCGEDSSTINAFKQINQQVFGLDVTQHFSSSSPYGCSSASTLLHGLFEPDHLQSTYENRAMINYQLSPSTNYQLNNSNELSSNSWSNKFIPQFLKNSSPPKQQQPSSSSTNQLHFSNNNNNNNNSNNSNNASFWNASSTSTNDIRSSLFPSPRTEYLTSQIIDEKPNSSSNKFITLKTNTEEIRDSGSLAKKNSSEPTFKRPRIETPSPLPTFKVRKEKLGDRITALQQLVSPFGKTDTASVLFEAIEYIKFLHEQVTVLSNPYKKNNGAPIQYHHQQQQQQISDHKLKDEEGPKQDLRSRGLCLVPISNTFPVVNEASTDFWSPTFGGTYR